MHIVAHKTRVTGHFNIFVIYQGVALEGPKGSKIFCELSSTGILESGSSFKGEDSVYFLSDHQ